MYIPNLTTFFIVQHAPPRFLHHPGVPHIYFSSYTRNQSIRILSSEPLDIFEDKFPDDMDYDDENHAEDKDWLWPRFCAAVWDSLAQSCARDLSSFRDVCHKLWRPFVTPIHKGDFGTRDFSRLSYRTPSSPLQRSRLQRSNRNRTTCHTTPSILFWPPTSRLQILPAWTKYIS